jgi:outer membrane protein TolC
MKPLALSGSTAARRNPRRRAVAAVFGALLVTLAAPCKTAAQAQETPVTIDFQDALALARKGPDVSLARLGVFQAEAARNATFSAASATLQGGYAQRWIDAVGYAPTRGGLAPFSLNATFNVVPYGPAHDARATADRSLETAQMALQDAVGQATLTAAQAYLEALRASQRLGLDASAVEQAQATLKHVQSLRAAGDATDDDVATAQVDLAQASTTRASDRLALQSALASLSYVLGRPVSAVNGEPPASKDPQDDDGDAVSGRSDVRQASLAVDASRQDYAAAVRQVLPAAEASASVQGGDGSNTWNAAIGFNTNAFQPSLQAGFTPGGSTLNGGTALNGTSFAITLSLSVPLDTGLGPALESARLSLTAAQQKLARTRQQATLAIASARRTLQSAQLDVGLSVTQRDLAAAQAAQAAQRFDLGLVAGPTLDQANLAADQARLAWLTAQDAVLLDRMALAQALGLDPMEVF